ncbi:MAG: flagellar hook-length control protein FliK [Lachnospiraceae bacterium]|nr:flagellar hook-length control protein FliK [Lachnospiraceae bacterium]
MAIAAISELSMQGLMPGMVQPQKEEAKGDFMQAFNNARDDMASEAASLKTEGTAAKGKDSADQNTANADRRAAGGNVQSRKADTPDSDTAAVQNKEQQNVQKSTDNSINTEASSAEEELPDDNALAAVATAVQQLIDALAELFNMDPEELTGAINELTAKGMGLFDAGAAGELVAMLKGEGDIASLLTDSSLKDLAGQVSELIDNTIKEAGELIPKEPERFLAAALMNVENADDAKANAAQSVESLTSDAILPAAEIADTVLQDPSAGQRQTQNGNEAGADVKDGHAPAKTQRAEHEAEEAFRPEAAMVQNNGGEVQAPVDDALRSELQSLRYTSSPEQILEQVTEQIRAQRSEDMSSLEMVLHPASLGSVAVRLVSQDGHVSALFTTQNEAVRDALAGQLAILKENMEQAGVKVEAVEVTVGSHAFEQNLEQGNDGQSDAEAQEQARLRRATHRIDLGDYAEGEEIVVDEADAVTVQMMQADGNRMDYRA